MLWVNAFFKSSTPIFLRLTAFFKVETKSPLRNNTAWSPSNCNVSIAKILTIFTCKETMAQSSHFQMLLWFLASRKGSEWDILKIPDRNLKGLKWFPHPSLPEDNPLPSDHHPHACDFGILGVSLWQWRKIHGPSVSFGKKQADSDFKIARVLTENEKFIPSGPSSQSTNIFQKGSSTGQYLRSNF